MEVVLATGVYLKIMQDIERGIYAEYNGRVAWDYTDEESDLDILVTMVNDGFYLREMCVEIVDEDGVEWELCDAQWRNLRKMAEDTLLEAERENRSEANYVKYLWDSAYA